MPKSQRRNKRALSKSKAILHRTAAAVSAANDTTTHAEVAHTGLATGGPQVVTTYTQPNIEILDTDIDVPLIIRLPRDVYNIVSIFG